MQYKVISTDHHLQEADDTYLKRMPEKWGDKLPQVRPNGDGTDSWYIYGERQ